jgi:periplasmic protein TonB
MKHLFLLLLLIPLSAAAQEVPVKPDPQNMTVVTNQEPFYPKGEQALYTHVFYNVKYSEEAKKKYIEGEVTLSFDVMPDSTVKNTNVVTGLGYGIDEEVQRVVKTLKFAPAIQNGTKMKMNVMYTFPVKAH